MDRVADGATGSEQSQHPEFWDGQGCALCEAGDYQTALQAFDKAIALDNRFCRAWNNRANALCGLKRYAEALAAYDRAVALQPDYHQAWFNRGLLLAEMMAYGNALESYARAIAIQPDPRYLHAQEDLWLKQKLIATTI
ncbi:MAG: tetratricopeptide repeat protein [Synechococcales cyanobacterium C42_A2020_086]|nr:tetratricopeptide repeat protein [Synechococcales cyanobacterium M58_A2018_015]MBF2073894.1 tetratricopeptide repeat protein [Synechococcales cyanobacterium C42_A2020_086]